MAKKLESTFRNMVVVLALVTTISAAGLGGIYELTKAPIQLSQQAAQEAAIASVLPSNFEELGDEVQVQSANDDGQLTFFPAYSNSGELVGYAIKTYTKSGYSGLIDIMVGLRPDGEITGFKVLQHAETPGLGSKMEEWFNNADRKGQYVVGRNPMEKKLTVSKDGGDVDAITAATITSRAFLESIDRASQTLKANADAINSRKQ